MRLHFAGTAFDYQALRAMAYTTYGGAEPGEVLATVDRIRDGDTESWHAEWRRTAERVHRAADAALDADRSRTARFAYLRAHTYYRTAEFFLAPDDPRRRPTYERSRETFRAGTALLDAPPDVVEIPYEGTSLPGYLFVPPDADGPLPTVVCLGGFDSLAEGLYFLCGVPEALARGYAVLLFDGPGQGAPLRHKGLTARPDWEHVVGPVVEFLAGVEWVDRTRIACPMLVLAGEDDHFVPLGLAQEFVDALTAPTTLRVFTSDEGAGEHCQVGNLRLATGVIYDWLDETLAPAG